MVAQDTSIEHPQMLGTRRGEYCLAVGSFAGPESALAARRPREFTLERLWRQRDRLALAARRETAYPQQAGWSGGLPLCRHSPAVACFAYRELVQLCGRQFPGAGCAPGGPA